MIFLLVWSICYKIPTIKIELEYGEQFLFDSIANHCGLLESVRANKINCICNCVGNKRFALTPIDIKKKEKEETMPKATKVKVM